LLSSGRDDDVCGGMVTALSMQVVGSSLLSLGCDDTGSGMVAMSSRQVMVMVGAIAGSCCCRIVIRCRVVVWSTVLVVASVVVVVHGGAIVVIAGGSGCVNDADGGGARCVVKS